MARSHKLNAVLDAAYQVGEEVAKGIDGPTDCHGLETTTTRATEEIVHSLQPRCPEDRYIQGDGVCSCLYACVRPLPIVVFYFWHVHAGKLSMDPSLRIENS